MPINNQVSDLWKSNDNQSLTQFIGNRTLRGGVTIRMHINLCTQIVADVHMKWEPLIPIINEPTFWTREISNNYEKKI